MPTDRELFAAYLAHRDEGAFTELWNRHHSMVVAVARRMVGHPADADDVAQEVFSELSRCTTDIESPAAWLHRAATFRAIDRLRTGSGLQRALNHRTEPTYVMRTPDWGVDAQVDQALETLGDLDRRLIVLHLLEGRSQQEVAVEVGLDPANVSRRVSAARTRLKQVLESMGLGGSALSLPWLMPPPVLKVRSPQRLSPKSPSITAVTAIGVGVAVVGLFLLTGARATIPEPVAVPTRVPSAAPMEQILTPAIVATVIESPRTSPVTRAVQSGDLLLPDDVRGIVRLPDGTWVLGQLQRDTGNGLTQIRDGVLVPPLELPQDRVANHGLVVHGNRLWSVLAIQTGNTWPHFTWKRELWQLLPDQRLLVVLDDVVGPQAPPAGGLGLVGDQLVVSLGDRLTAFASSDGVPQWSHACPGAREIAGSVLRLADESLKSVAVDGRLSPLTGSADFIAPGQDGGILKVNGALLQAHDVRGNLISETTTTERGISGLWYDAQGWVVAANGGGTASAGGLGAAVIAPGRWTRRSIGTIDSVAQVKDGSLRTSAQRWSAQGDFLGWTIDALTYPDDPRAHGMGSAAWTANVHGRELLLVGHDFGNCTLYRVNAAGVAIPVACWMMSSSEELPTSGEDAWPSAASFGGSWRWYDLDGDGHLQHRELTADPERGYAGSCWLDSAGGVWRNVRIADGIRYTPMDHLVDDGRPVLGATRVLPVPLPFLAIDRLAYDVAADALYVTGFTAERPARSDDGRQAGSELARIDGYLHGARQVRWRSAIAYEKDSSNRASGFTIADGAIFVGNQHMAQVSVFDAATGASWGKLSAVDERPGVSDGWNWAGLNATRQATGSYVVTVSDRRGWIRWHWSPPQ